MTLATGTGPWTTACRTSTTDSGDSEAVTNLGDTQKGAELDKREQARDKDVSLKNETDDTKDDSIHNKTANTKAKHKDDKEPEEPWPDLYADHRGHTQEGLHAESGRTRPDNCAARHAEPSEGLEEEEKERLRVDNSEDTQVMQMFIGNLPKALTQEVLREVTTKDQEYQRLMVAGKQDRKPTDKDRAPHRAVREEPGIQEELLSRGERSAIPGGQHKKDGVHEEGDTYPLANPGLAEAPDIDHSTVVPRTGADRSATQPLIDTNPLYMQHQYKDEESRHIDKTRHNGAGAKTEAGTNTGDYIHGDSHQDGHRSRDKTKAEINIGNTHHDGYRASARTKAETIIGDPKAMTNLGDSHQEGHRAGAKDKANDLVIAKRKTTKHDSARDPKP